MVNHAGLILAPAEPGNRLNPLSGNWSWSRSRKLESPGSDKTFLPPPQIEATESGTGVPEVPSMGYGPSSYSRQSWVDGGIGVEDFLWSKLYSPWPEFTG